MALRRSAVVFGAIVFGSLLVAPGVAHAAHVGCGQVITTNTTLDSNVGPCPGNGIIIRAENVTLDLNGYSVLGAAPSGTGSDSVGILVDFVGGAQVRNGTVAGFGRGVVLLQRAGSTLERLNVRGNRNVGIVVSSFQNVVRGNVVEGNGGDGVFIAGGPGNVIESNVIRGNGGTGFFLTAGGLNSRTGGTVLRGNSISANGLDGVVLGGLTGGASVTSNVIAENRRNGVVIGELAGLHLVQSNQILANLANGVRIVRTPGPPAPGSRVLSNTALRNALFDLADENENCDSNTWSGNQFGTRNQTCIN
jgi:parallel beta-helix repeat protein